MSVPHHVFESAVNELKEVLCNQAEIILLRTLFRAGISVEPERGEIQKDTPLKTGEKSGEKTGEKAGSSRSVSSVAKEVMDSMSSSSDKKPAAKADKPPVKAEKPASKVEKPPAEKPAAKAAPADKKKCGRSLKSGEVCGKGAAYEVGGEFYCKRCSEVVNNALSKEKMKDAVEKKIASTSTKAQSSDSKTSKTTSAENFKSMISNIVGPSAERAKQIVARRKKLKDGTIVHVDESRYVWDPDAELRTIIGKIVDGKVVRIFDDNDHKYVTRHRINLSNVVQYTKEKGAAEDESSGSENDDKADLTDDDELVLSDSE